MTPAGPRRHRRAWSGAWSRDAAAAVTSSAEGRSGGTAAEGLAGWISAGVDVGGAVPGALALAGDLAEAGAGAGCGAQQRCAMVVFSGGTAFNTVAHELQRELTTSVAHVLPVSDDGGSTAEIVRVLGGPAVGDIRSRCLRLSDDSTSEARAVKALLAHRVASCVAGKPDASAAEVALAARNEWLAIVEGDEGGTVLWEGISAPYRDTIRAFLVHFHVNILRHATERFDFTGLSVGNAFFAGARLFFRSMNAAIFMYSRVSGIPPESRVLPAVVTEERLAIGVELEDGTHIRGQHNISHPSDGEEGEEGEEGEARSAGRGGESATSEGDSGGEGVGGAGEGRKGGGTKKDKAKDKKDKKKGKRAKTASVKVAKGGPVAKTRSPIARLVYLFHDVNQPANWWDDKQRVHPEANPEVLSAIDGAGCVVYGMGSLYTSVVPTLILDGVGEGIVDRVCPKVLLLNGWHDRETSWVSVDPATGEATERAMDAAGYVRAICEALDCSYARTAPGEHPPAVHDYVTHLLYPDGCEVAVDPARLAALVRARGDGPPVKIVRVASVPAAAAEGGASGAPVGTVVFNPQALVGALRRVIYEWGLAHPVTGTARGA